MGSFHFTARMSAFAALVAFMLSGAAAPGQEAAKGRDNLLTNPSFEQGAEGWQLHAFSSKGKMTVDETEKRAGKPTLRIDNPEGDDTFVKQKVTVKPDTRYRLTGFIKTKDVQPIKRNDKNGACLAVEGGYVRTPPVLETKAWTKVTHEFATGRETEIEVGPRLGFYSAMVTGTAWFAELSLVELGRARR